MSKALNSVKILDFTHVQSGPTCTQLLAPGSCRVTRWSVTSGGDIPRGQLQDIPKVDSLLFRDAEPQRSITMEAATMRRGKAVIEALMKTDVMVENFAGALEPMGFTWNASSNSTRAPRSRASVLAVEDCKVYENVARARVASRRPPVSTTARRWYPREADTSNPATGLHLAAR